VKVFTQTNNLFQEALTSYEVFYTDRQTIPREVDLWSSICDFLLIGWKIWRRFNDVVICSGQSWPFVKHSTQTDNLPQETLTSYEVFYIDIQTIPREVDLWSSICDALSIGGKFEDDTSVRFNDVVICRGQRWPLIKRSVIHRQMYYSWRSYYSVETDGLFQEKLVLIELFYTDRPIFQESLTPIQANWHFRPKFTWNKAFYTNLQINTNE
jgi:hypothetical protein